MTFLNMKWRCEDDHEFHLFCVKVLKWRGKKNLTLLTMRRRGKGDSALYYYYHYYYYYDHYYYYYYYFIMHSIVLLPLDDVLSLF